MKRPLIQPGLGLTGPSHEYTPHWLASPAARWKCMRMLAGAGGVATAASILPPNSLALGAALLALSLPPQAASRAGTPVAVINFRCETKLQFSFMLVSMFYRFLPTIVCGLDWFVILLPKKYGKDKYSAECCWACTAP